MLDPSRSRKVLALAEVSAALSGHCQWLEDLKQVSKNLSDLKVFLFCDR